MTFKPASLRVSASLTETLTSSITTTGITGTRSPLPERGKQFPARAGLGTHIRVNYVTRIKFAIIDKREDTFFGIDADHVTIAYFRDWTAGNSFGGHVYG
jgi:hypothetical protein